MIIEVFKFCVDFGLLVLILMVQLIVYPSFLHFSKTNLIKWHQSYTPKITTIVAPLMIAQVALHAYTLIFSFSYLQVIQTILIASVWLITFLYFVPLHQKIESKQFTTQNLKNLINYNWLRTIIWLFIVLLSLLEL